jgi:hypothetical protein
VHNSQTSIGSGYYVDRIVEFAPRGSHYPELQQAFYVFLYFFSLSFWDPELFHVDRVLLLELNIVSHSLALACVEETVTDGVMMFQ